MAVKVFSSQVVGLKADVIDVDVDLTNGLHSFSLVGLPDKAVEESKDRVCAAIKNSGFVLSVAMAYLLASKQIFFEPAGKIFLGELALNGEIRPIKGVLSLVKNAKSLGFEEIFLPKANAKEAALIDGVKIFACEKLEDIANHFDKENTIALKEQPKTEIDFDNYQSEILFDFSDIKGQETAKRGLEIAAAGGHNVMMSGPAGT